MPTPRRTNEERTRTTRRALISAARQRFEADGYEGTNLDRVAELAGVTKGALYHHFPTKRALYDAVVVDIQDELHVHLAGRVDKTETAWARLVEAFVAFIEMTPHPTTRMLMVEAPAILGYERWREIGEERHLSGIVDLLQDVQATGELAFDASRELARVLNAMVNAVGTLISQDDDPVALRATVIPVWEHLLRSLEARPATEDDAHE